MENTKTLDSILMPSQGWGPLDLRWDRYPRQKRHTHIPEDVTEFYQAEDYDGNMWRIDCYPDRIVVVYMGDGTPISIGFLLEDTADVGTAVLDTLDSISKMI